MAEARFQLFGHPFSSYTWKALIAFYETGTSFAFRMLSPDHPENGAAFAVFWPVGKFPLLVDSEVSEGGPIVESSIIVEHVAPQLIPADRDAVREVRMLDRVFDNHVMNAMMPVVIAAIRQGDVDAARSDAEVALDKVYGWLDARLAGRVWAAGEAFTLADCAAGPSLFYADWVHPIPETHGVLKAYRARLLARPSIARCVDEARPYRHLFPLGAPDRD